MFMIAFVVYSSADVIMMLFNMFFKRGVCLCIIYVVSFSVTPIIGDTDTTRIVTIGQGPVRGYREGDSNVFAFYNIPYATAPTGRDKFKAPLPPPTWTEIYDNKDEFIVCPQDLLGIVTKEDCLIANIYVPDTNNTNLPVMIEVHGGAFQIGMGRLATYNDLIKVKDIIVVNFNYRLGAHGFLCLGTEVAPGNAGMKDQLALLRWVKTNIKSFGGNPDDITIVGCSAGGVSVDLLRVASVTDGLFHKVIVGSGATAGSFGLQVDPLANAKQYAVALGFKNENENDLSALEEFYITLSYETLTSRQDLIHGRTDSTVIFAPCVERNTGLETVEIFIEEAPVNLMKKNAVKPLPTLYGFSNMEGLIRIDSFDQWTIKMNENFSQYIPADLQFETKEDREAVAAKLKQFYFADKPVNSETILSYIDYFSDVLFMHSMLWSLKLHEEANNESKFYLYEYSFIDESKQNYPFNVRGANHCDQFFTLYDENEANLTEEYKNIKNIMRRMYSDFITTGNPVSEGSLLPTWQPANSNRTPHMAFGTEISLQGPLHFERSKLWDEIYEKHYSAPIPPGNDASALNYFSAVWLAIGLFLLK